MPMSPPSPSRVLPSVASSAEHLPRRFAGLVGRSPATGTDPISEAILASAERARRLGGTVPLRRDDEYWLVQKGRLLLSALGGFGIGSMALFLLTLE
jgi:hypothetical protein